MSSTAIEDRLAIEELFIRYTCALDIGDVDTLVACFAEDGALQSPAIGAYRGRAAIREFATRFAAFQKNGSQLRHIISNLRTQVNGTTGTAKCYLVVYLTRDGKSRLLAPGEYDCDLVKHDGAWLFQRRVVTMDHDYTLDGI